MRDRLPVLDVGTLDRDRPPALDAGTLDRDRLPVLGAGTLDRDRLPVLDAGTLERDMLPVLGAGTLERDRLPVLGAGTLDRDNPLALVEGTLADGRRPEVLVMLREGRRPELPDKPPCSGRLDAMPEELLGGRREAATEETLPCDRGRPPPTLPCERPAELAVGMLACDMLTGVEAWLRALLRKPMCERESEPLRETLSWVRGRWISAMRPPSAAFLR